MNQRVLIARAVVALAAVTPQGFRQEFVVPPWKGKGCRSCQKPDKKKHGPWVSVLVTRLYPDEETLRFTFATLCRGCWTKPQDEIEREKERLADMAFAAQPKEKETDADSSPS